MNIKEKIVSNNREMYNFPIKKGLLLGDIALLMFASLYIGLSAGLFIIDYDVDVFLPALLVFVFFLIFALVNFYYSSFKVLRKYENEHGSTKYGDEKYGKN